MYYVEVIWRKSKRKHFSLSPLHGGGDALLGNRGTGQPMFAETLRVDDVLPRLHSHVLAHLARVARWQLGWDGLHL